MKHGFLYITLISLIIFIVSSCNKSSLCEDANFVGEWSGQAECTTTQSEINLEFTTSAENEFRIAYKDFVIEAIRTDCSFSGNSTVGNDEVEITGTLLDSTMQVSLTEIKQFTSSCTADLTRK